MPLPRVVHAALAEINSCPGPRAGTTNVGMPTSNMEAVERLQRKYGFAAPTAALLAELAGLGDRAP